MKSGSASILVLENDSLLSDMIRSHLHEALPQVTPFFARSIAEANVFIYQYEFDVFLIDVGLPDGNGLEFVMDLKTVLPDAPIIIMTGQSFAELQPQLEHLGLNSFLQKPFDILELERKVAQICAKTLQSTSFQGSLRQMRLVDLIQLKCLNHDSCQMIITGPSSERGTITIDQGNIIHAATSHSEGISAFNQILQWKNGFFQENEFKGGVAVNIQGNWELLLMEAVRQSDECYAMEAI